MSEDKRRRLDEILGGSAPDFNSLWDRTDAADDHEPLPAGEYRCLVADGRVAESKANRTPSYKVVFEVVAPAEFAGRRLWFDAWLTPKALPTTKRDLGKLGIVRPDQLQRPPATGLIASVKVALRTGDDGVQFNKVTAFKVTGSAPPPAALEPDADDLDDDDFDGVESDDDEDDDEFDCPF